MNDSFARGVITLLCIVGAAAGLSAAECYASQLFLYRVGAMCSPCGHPLALPVPISLHPLSSAHC